MSCNGQMIESAPHLVGAGRCEGEAPPLLLPPPGPHVADVDPGRGLRNLVVAGTRLVLALRPVLVTAGAAEAATRPLPGPEPRAAWGGAL